MSHLDTTLVHSMITVVLMYSLYGSDWIIFCASKLLFTACVSLCITSPTMYTKIKFIIVMFFVSFLVRERERGRNREREREGLLFLN